MYGWVKKYIGIPFVSNGRTAAGCDCYGLARLVLRNEFGVEWPDYSEDYSNALNIAQTARLFAERLPVLAVEKITEAEEGAVVIISARGRPAHIGIAAGGGYILHAAPETGSACQRESHPGLRGRIQGYYRAR
jgi:cell wall-associated NlpC family hydrolase